MKHLISTAFLLFTSAAMAQLDRTGNVSDDGAPPGGAIGQVFIGAIVGAVLGAAYAKYKDSPEKPFATDGGAVIGGIVGAFVWPFLLIL